MAFIERRIVTALTAAAAIACLGGCASVNNAPGVAAATPAAASKTNVAQTRAPEPPSANGMYGEMRDGAFNVPALKSGQVAPAYQRQNVAYSSREAPGTIVIDPANRYLYHVEEGGRATRYGVAVGREGFAWSGEATIKNKQEWPDWYPPKEMIERRPELKQEVVQLQSGLGMHGGPSNPLGARAMYLWQGDRDTLFRIHGTNEPWTIGQSKSSGCIRMINQDVIDLYQKVQPGARVVVLPAKVARASQ
jgi:lipoprotein-anchoring transpeptidase ErfK/SrfK